LEDVNDQENGEQPKKNGTQDPFGRTATSDQLTKKTNHCCNNNPNEHLRQRDHIDISLLKDSVW
jgi:hypothetical protein